MTIRPRFWIYLDRFCWHCYLCGVIYITINWILRKPVPSRMKVISAIDAQEAENCCKKPPSCLRFCNNVVELKRCFEVRLGGSWCNPRPYISYEYTLNHISELKNYLSWLFLPLILLESVYYLWLYNLAFVSYAFLRLSGWPSWYGSQ